MVFRTYHQTIFADNAVKFYKSTQY